MGQQTDRRGLTKKIIRNLLSERQDMLVAYCRLAGLEPYAGHQPLKKELEDFCQLLMDYTALGHFELYARIIDGQERRSDVLGTAENIISALEAVTAETVAFNDKYDGTTRVLDLSELSKDLSALGEHLARRLELEDRLLQAFVPSPPKTN